VGLTDAPASVIDEGRMPSADKDGRNAAAMRGHPARWSRKRPESM
jgi:hypothetical protein